MSASNLANNYIPCLTKVSALGLVPKLFLSCELGLVKPDPGIYRYVSDYYDYNPEEICIIGDNFKYDYLVPKSLGYRAVWLNRKGEKEGVRLFSELKDYVIENNWLK